MEKEIKHISGSAGGFLVGRSHANNGIKAINKATGQPLEMEGGEVVITKTAVDDSEKREFEGEMLTNREILSRINVSGGGVSFAEGGEIPEELYFDETEYSFSGEKLPGHAIAHRISSCGCKHNNQNYTIEEIDILISKAEEETRKLVANNDFEKLQKANKLIGDLIDQRNLIYNKNYYDILNDPEFKKGGILTDSEKESLYKEWNRLVNMNEYSLKSYYDSEDGEDSGLSEHEAKEQGIKSGRESARWIIKMKQTNVSSWTPEMWEWAKRQVSFIKRMTGVEGKLYDENGNKTRKHKALLIWGHNPEKYAHGGNLKKGAENDDLDNVTQVSDEVLDGPDIIASEGSYFEKGGFLPTDIPQKLRSDIAFLVDLQDKKQNNRPSGGWDINLFKSSFFNKVKKLPNDQAIVVLDFLTALEETVGVKPIFSKNHKIWENYSTQKEVSNNSEFQVGDKIKYKNSSEVGEVIDVIPSQFEDIILIKYPNGEIVKDGVSNLEKAEFNLDNVKSIRKYKDSTIQDRYNFQDKKQEYSYIVEFESGKQWIGYAENRDDAKTKALAEFDNYKTTKTSKYQVGDFVKYETGDLETERWVGEIKEVKNYGNEIAYRIDAYTRGVAESPMFDSSQTNEKYEVELQPTNDLVFNEAKKHYNRVMANRQLNVSKKYDLGASFAGGVTVVWDRNQTKNGDYKTIAHIPSNGSIKYFEENLPQYVIDYVEGVKSNSNNQLTETNYSISNYRNPYEVNRAIEKLIDSKESGFTPNEIEFISNYSGYGGLEKQGSFSDEELKGLLYEYFTPDAIVKKMWALAYKYGFGTIENPHVMEPSVGTGNFFKYAPINAELFGNEINRFSKKVCEILYPKAMITLQPFEKNFISKNNSIKNKLSDIHKYHLVIGNPPYGRADSKFLAMGEKDYTKASNFTEYFITRGLDLLHPGGLLIFVVGAEQYNGGTLFLDSGISTVKKNIFDKAQLVDAYRLPTKIFERTGVASEILVFKKK